MVKEHETTAFPLVAWFVHAMALKNKLKQVLLQGAP